MSVVALDLTLCRSCPGLWLCVESTLWPCSAQCRLHPGTFTQSSPYNIVFLVGNLLALQIRLMTTMKCNLQPNDHLKKERLRLGSVPWHFKMVRLFGVRSVYDFLSAIINPAYMTSQHDHLEGQEYVQPLWTPDQNVYVLPSVATKSRSIDICQSHSMI